MRTEYPPWSFPFLRLLSLFCVQNMVANIMVLYVGIQFTSVDCMNLGSFDWLIGLSSWLVSVCSTSTMPSPKSYEYEFKQWMMSVCVTTTRKKEKKKKEFLFILIAVQVVKRGAHASTRNDKKTVIGRIH